MILHRTMDPAWLSNAYLVADEPGGHAVLVDTGGPCAPLLEKIESLGLTLTHILCTHHHADHVAHNQEFHHRLGAPVCGHRLERDLFGSLDVELEDGQALKSGNLRIEAHHIPGHTVGQLAFLVNGTAVFTGDTLFRDSIGGTRAPGHTTYADLRHSIMEVLMQLPPETMVYPGHTEGTTIGHEWEHNPFIRAWRGLDEVQPRPCVALGEAAELLLRARDYDGGSKCWVRFAASGEMDIVPGSRVKDG